MHGVRTVEMEDLECGACRQHVPQRRHARHTHARDCAASKCTQHACIALYTSSSARRGSVGSTGASTDMPAAPSGLSVVVVVMIMGGMQCEYSLHTLSRDMSGRCCSAATMDGTAPAVTLLSAARGRRNVHERSSLPKHHVCSVGQSRASDAASAWMPASPISLSGVNSREFLIACICRTVEPEHRQLRQLCCVSSQRNGARVRNAILCVNNDGIFTCKCIQRLDNS